MNFQTKDSGKREEFDSGMVRDTQDGKPRFDLLFPKGIPYDQQIVTRFAALMERGVAKYGERNWEKGNSQVELERAQASAIRHLVQWLSSEDDEDHAAGVFFNIMQAETLKYKMGHATGRQQEEVEADYQAFIKPHVSVVNDEWVSRCLEMCDEHVMKVCLKEYEHPFKHTHDDHWWDVEEDQVE